ncbi:Acetamidase regulatory protein [Colletotrichum trifolii]|uniref:Acetamidase regulatory protein n=1 Tax=Colletotrichum trifolii TaxID=5466 RepID=A0A4R8RNM2_COLTR|nr:Acetamidase regulatory protein [Colletotrichum trifolii]
MTAPATPTGTTSWADPTSAGLAPRPSTANDAAALGDGANEDGTQTMADFLNREDAEQREILRHGRLFFIGSEFSNLHYLVRQRSRCPDQRVLHFGSHPMVPKLPSVPAEVLELPPKPLADELIRTYFVRVNRALAIVDEDDFIKVYNDAHGDGHLQKHRPLSLLLLNAVFLVGARVSDPDRQDIKSLRSVFIRRTKALFDSRYEQHRETYLQAALLLTWQCEDLEDIVSNTWYWIGVATRIAFGMGMHRDATPSNLNPMDKRLWIRLWWMLFQFDVLVATNHGRLQAINLDESDVPPLEPHHFEGISEPQCDFNIQHTRLCIIFSKAMRKRVSLQSTPADRAEATREADARLADLIMSLPEQLQLSTSDPDPWQAVFHLSYSHFLILLHRPKPGRASDSEPASPQAVTDLSICCDAAVTICSVFESLRARNLLSRLWIPSIHVLFTAMVHFSDQMRSANPIMAAKSRRHFDSLITTLHALKGHWLYAQSLLNLFEARATSANSRNRINTDAGVQVEGQRGSMVYPTPETMGGGHGLVAGSTPAMAIGGGPQQFLANTSLAGQHDNAVGDEHMYGANFVGDGLGPAVGVDAVDMLQLPSALEFLLAGVGDDFGFM